MEFRKYRTLVEDRFGFVSLPNNEEIQEVLDVLKDLLETPSIESYRILQAIEIIEAWRIEDGRNYVGNET